MKTGFLPRAGFQLLLDLLQRAGYRCIGPRVRDGAIVYDSVERAEDFPRGVRDHQSGGKYRLEKVSSARIFGWANGPQALKPMVFAPEAVLWQARRTSLNNIEFSGEKSPSDKLAVIGVRACDLAALALQDRHFLAHAAADPCYAARRDALFLIAVHCSDPADTCFCASTGDGPQATAGFDIAMSELEGGFVVEAGSARGAEVMSGLSLAAVSASQVAEAAAQIASARERQTRHLPSRNLRDVLFANLQHPRWAQVAERCLACGNCTSVCPTCFCSAEADVTQLDGAMSTHVRRWDSCFTQGHSYIHGLTVRSDTRARYRQWLTHKLGSWHDQYGRSGCVGCGRCISWCPVGIDITEEATAICAVTGDG